MHSLEESITKIVLEVLEFPEEKIGAHDLWNGFV
ncbi:hypothetical protein SAMN05661091_1381 [Paenibacillus uliginis N3/975]|uniref:Uncharacterized protein n=1 Tax=Paenibacillus uliginis N3/975 TaxID=1313296 RepID=A0A1X7GZH7_9BACL|nr:hypothetical protein SAMN05661091_1381 [Paenibacillus uliginis N3/975]